MEKLLPFFTNLIINLVILMNNKEIELNNGVGDIKRNSTGNTGTSNQPVIRNMTEFRHRIQ